MRKFFSVVLMLLVLASLTTSTVFAQDPDNGKVLWEEQVWQCQRCHGPAGEGNFARPLSNSTLTAQEWIAQVRMPRQFMPHFSEAQVSDEQLIDIHAYITSQPAPADFTPTMVDLPADAPEGQRLVVQKRCVACHDTTGPLRNFVDRGEAPTTDAVIAQLRSPKQFMPSFSPDQVSDAEAGLIADFLAEQFAAQAPPSNLPQSGGSDPTTLPLTLSLIGGTLVLAGLALRQLNRRA